MDKQFLRMFNMARYQQWADFENFDITKDCQDQLQEIAHSAREKTIPISGNHGLALAFAYWIENESSLPCASMEQLWLAFVMRKLYRKAWNGSEWK